MTRKNGLITQVASLIEPSGGPHPISFSLSSLHTIAFAPSDPPRSLAAALEERMVFANRFSRQSAAGKVSEADADDDAEDVNEDGQPDHGYPSDQLFILGCCRLSEPVSMTSSQPYLYFMIRDFDITDDEKQIGRYVGFLASCYSFSQCLTGTNLDSGK